MRTSEIILRVSLDKDNVPERITWEATDKPADAPADTRCFSLAIWDQGENNTLSINLWDKQMMMGEMKKFYLQTVAGLTETLMSATADEQTHNEVAALLDKLSTRFMQEEKAGKL